MNITVVGYGHFAGVAAMCLAEKGHAINQTDFEPRLVREGQKKAEEEPGYAPPTLAQTAPLDLVWVAYDAPLDAQGAPVVGEIVQRVRRLHLDHPIEVPFIVSCQWPVGTLADVEVRCPGRTFWYVLENVRVGKAVEDFRHPASIVIGARRPDDLPMRLFNDFTPRVLVMAPESAEMVKHAINAFMALQIAFINEIAHLSCRVGANPHDVSAALLSDARVGTFAPLRAGGPFGGGSLARDLRVLNAIAEAHGVEVPILAAILPSNEARR